MKKWNVNTVKVLVKKDGKQKDGTQKWRCKKCEKYQQKSYKYLGKIQEKRRQVVPMLLNNCGFKGIARVLGIALNTVMKIIFAEKKKIKEPAIPTNGIYEIDEMRAYKKTGKDIWVCYALERKSREVIGLSVGKRDEQTLRKTINKVLMTGPKRIYTDGYGIYRKLIPEGLHKVSKKMLWKVERKHLDGRNNLKMLNRSTLSFVRKTRTLLACLKLLFWHKDSPLYFQ